MKANRTPWIRFVSQNVQSLPQMTQTHVIEDVSRTAQDGDVIVWQEVLALERYQTALRHQLRAWHNVILDQPNGGCAISFRNIEWHCLRTDKIMLHAGVEGVSADRFIIMAMLEHKVTGAKLLVHTWHYVAGAWNIKDDINEKVRIPLWHQDVANHRKFLKPFVDQGIPILGGGDNNRRLGHSLGLPQGERVGRRKINYMVPDESIDGLLAINGSEWRWDIAEGSEEHLDNRHSDHGGRRVRVRLVHQKVSA